MAPTTDRRQNISCFFLFIYLSMPFRILKMRLTTEATLSCSGVVDLNLPKYLSSHCCRQIVKSAVSDVGLTRRNQINREYA